MGSDWFDILLPEFKKPYFAKLKQALEKKVKQDKVYPPLEQVYSWSKYTPFDKVKVVIIGQDPYHQPGQAHGLAFSVNKGVYIPPSLQNIYKGIKIDYPEFNIPKHGYLKKWADQGVLLLNTVLTVKESNPNSHKSLQWEKLTDEIIKQIGVNRSNVVFLLWGNNAKQKATFIDRSKNLILESVHPSPLSVRHGFFSAKHFIKTNEYLEANGLETIDWGKVNEE
ncbi:uracil-DNA glycosylase [Conidiobolus coronatus NRRL 28638]|uniref:Uracil-DNA glycosylase n=1 Tax=Conidiobolus coronatus (strain ATCC 28846 / CBS 209.66 / NRRL 28638) TaxID=796925 RepID=A0A137P5V9_CONC2|nr:uracil-DNA glycosylase [Conidiobolus coronatus NRRL 28638]|eukprot:KXN70398.1 uracil-DNA glycosylase [Conidiobolus coronatus NRRL 28638]